MKGKSSAELTALLGYIASEEVVHRENCALLEAAGAAAAGDEDDADEMGVRAQLANVGLDPERQQRH